jgi:hypothetical protein
VESVGAEGEFPITVALDERFASRRAADLLLRDQNDDDSVFLIADRWLAVNHDSTSEWKDRLLLLVRLFEHFVEGLFRVLAASANGCDCHEHGNKGGATTLSTTARLHSHTPLGMKGTARTENKSIHQSARTFPAACRPNAG